MSICLFSNDITVNGNLVNHGLVSAYPPSPSFDFSKNPKCDALFWTKDITDKIYSNDKSSFSGDFVKDENLNPFKKIFGVNREDWMIVKEKFSYIIIDGVSNKPSDCSNLISNEVEKGISKIWLIGSCDLSNVGDIHNIKPIVIVIQDGVVGFSGTTTKVNALIYQFLTPGTSWKPSDSDWGLTSVSAHVPDKTKYIHYQFGALHTSAGFVFDMPGYIAKPSVSLNLHYDESITNEISESLSYMVKGSWRDF